MTFFFSQEIHLNEKKNFFTLFDFLVDIHSQKKMIYSTEKKKKKKIIKK